MLRLIYSNRLDELSEPLVASIREARRRDPLEPVIIMIPNRAVEQFVRFRVAEALGVAASLKFVFLERFVAERVEKADDELRVLGADDLRLMIFERLRAGNFASVAELEPLEEYLRHGSADPAQRELRAFQLAGKAARLLQEYAFSRREMVARWREALRFAGKPAGDVERWQRRLWLALFDGESQWKFLPDAFAAVDPEKLFLPASLHVFALSNVAPEFIRIFERLASKTDVHVYALNPCLEFWEDVDTSWGLVRDRLVRRRPKLGNVFASESDDPFDLLSSQDTPALRLWGRPGREHVRLFNELTDCDHEPRFARPDRSRMLGRLQDDILCRAPERKPGEESMGASSDASIRFLACPGIRREAEIVGEKIWRLVRETPAPGEKPIRFHEIAVLFPDRAADAYLPHIESVFDRLHEIPVNVVQSRLGGESRLFEAVELLLDLPFGKLGRHELLQVLTHPAVVGSRADIDPDRWREWARKLGVVLGGDRGDLAGTYIEKDLYNWDQALRRLAAGAFLAGEASGETRRFGEDRPVLPEEVGGDDVAVAAELVRLARALISDIRACRSATLQLSEWIENLTALVLQYVEASDPLDERARSRCLEAIQSIAPDGVSLGPVSYPVVRDMIREATATVAERRGVLFGSGVAVGSLSTLRSLPFRVVFVLGLGEGEFPRGDSLDPLDLRTARRQPGDVSATERDRYLFLEALLAARERLFLSWVSRNPQTGEERKRSTIVSELEYVLRGYVPQGKIGELTISYPVSRYEPSAFPEIESDVEPAADDEGRRNARVAVARGKLLDHTGVKAFPLDRTETWELISPKVRSRLAPALRMPSLAGAATRRASGSTSGPEEISLSLSALRRFLECPLQGSVRAVLGLSGEEDPDDERPEEPLKLSALDKTIVLRDAFLHAGGEPKEAQRLLVEGLALRELRGVAPTGPFGEAARVACEQALEVWTRTVAPTDWQDVRIGQAEEFEEVDELLPPIVLDLVIDPHPRDRSAKRREVRLTLTGKAEPISPEGNRIVRCIAREFPSPRDLLTVHFSVMSLAAAGYPLAPELDLRVVGTDSTKIDARTFRAPAQESARRYLAGLARELLARVHDYFFPIEAVSEFYRPRRKNERRTLAEIIESMRSEPNSSKYGPVRGANLFPAPKDAGAILERRFAPFYGLRLERS